MFAHALRAIRIRAAILTAVTIAAVLLTPQGPRVRASALLWTDVFGGPLTPPGSARDFGTALDVAVDAQGFAYVTGAQVAGEIVGILRKYDTRTGALVWTRQFTHPFGTNGSTEGYGVAVHQSAAGTGVYVAGYSVNQLTLWKFDADGNEVWRFALSGPEYGYGIGYDVAVNADGDPYVTGEVILNGASTGVVVRVDQALGVGNTRMPIRAHNAPVVVTSIAFNSTGRMVIAGYAQAPLEIDPSGSNAGARDGFVAQLDPAFVLPDWVSEFGTPKNEDVTHIAIAPDDSVYAGGVADSDGFESSAFIRKYDRFGQLLWTNGQGIEQGYHRTYCGMAVDPVSGGIHIVGTNDIGQEHDRPCEYSAYLGGPRRASLNFSMYIDSFDADGTSLPRELLSGVGVPADEWTEAAHGEMPTAFGLAALGEDVLLTGNVQTYNFNVVKCPFDDPAYPLCPAAYGGDYGFLQRRSGLPKGRIELRADVPSVAAPFNQPVTITGTYRDVNGIKPTLSSSLPLTQTGEASGTWSVTSSFTLPGAQTVTVAAIDDYNVRTQISIPVTVAQPPPLILHADVDQITTEVVVPQVNGPKVRVSGTYEIPAVVPYVENPSMTSMDASLGSVTRYPADDSGRTGRWTWSWDPIVVGTQTVAVGLHIPGDSGGTSFTVTVLPLLPPSVVAANNAVTVRVFQTARMTGTYESPAGSPVLLSASTGTILPQNGGASGTWTWTGSPSVAGTETVTITAANAHAPELTSAAAFQVTALPAAAPVLSAQASTVTAAPGHVATNSGTYLAASGRTPTITASSGTVTQSGGPDGTWQWSQTVGESGQVTISAQDGSAAGTTSFQVNVSTSTTTVVSHDTPPYSQSLAFTAVVAPADGDQTPISGTVQFVVDGVNKDAPVPLNGGAATLTTNLNGNGAHTIEAVYSGEGDHLSPSRGSLPVIAENPFAVKEPNSSRQFGTAATDQVLAMTPEIFGGHIVAGLWNGSTSFVSGDWYPIEHVSSGEGFVRYYSQLGTESWTTHISAGALTVVRALSSDTDHIYVAGETAGTLAGQTAAGNRDAFVQAYDRGGTLLWTRQFGSASDDIAYGVAADGRGHVYVVGTTPGLPGQPAFGGADGFIRQYDTTGAEQWTREFGTPGTDQFFAVATTGADRIAITGYTGGSVVGGTYDGGGEDLLVTEWSDQGLQLWARQAGSGRNEQGLGVAGDADGNLYVVAVTNGNLDPLGLQNIGNGSDGALVKYDANGVVQWSREIGTDGTDVVSAVAVDVAGRIAVAGGTSNGSSGLEGHVWRFRGDGTPDGDAAIAAAKNATAIMFDHYGGLEVGGTTSGTLDGQTGAGGPDAFVVRSTDAAPAILTQPLSRTARPGDAVAFVATATNGWPWLKWVEWQVKTPASSDFTPIPGTNSSVYTVTADVAQDGNQYRAVFSNETGSATTEAATLHVHAPVITLTAASSSVTVTQGQLASLAGTYEDPLGAVPSISAPIGTVVVSPTTHSWTWALVTSTPIPTHAVTISATDGSGGSGTVTFDLTVLADTEPPAITVPANFTIEGGGPVTFDASALDAISGSVPVSCAPASGSVLPLGANTVTCTAADAAGNEAHESFIVTVVDTVAPAATILDWNENSVFDGQPIGVRVQATDAIGVTAVDVNGVPASLDSGTPQSGIWIAWDVPTQPAGYFELPTEISVSVSDSTGHTTNVPTIVADSDGIDASLDIVSPNDPYEYSDDFRKGHSYTRGRIETRGEFRVFIEDVAGTPLVRARVEGPRGQAPSARILACASSSNMQVVLDAGLEQAIWSCADGTGEITVTAEQAMPAGPGQPPGTIEIRKLGCITGGCAFNLVAALHQGDTLTTGSPFVADPENQSPIVVSIVDANDQPIGSFSLDPGESADAVPATGPHSEQAVTLETLQGDVTFTVNGQETTIGAGDPPATVPMTPDVLPPSIGPVSNITAEATGASGAAVTFALPAVTDDMDPSPVVVVSAASGSVFPIGSTMVTITATDAAGNTALAAFSITVADTTPPALTLPDAMTVTSTSAAGTPVSWTAAASDLVGGNVPVTCSPSSGSLFALGTTSVSCSAADAVGNAAHGSFSVTVVDQPPVAMPDAADTLEETPVTIAVLANDSDADGGTPMIASVGAAGHGTVVVNIDGTVTYTPGSGFTGVDSFTYVAADGQGLSATGTVTITVSPRPLRRFVVMGVNHTRLAAGVTVVTGSVGTNGAAAGDADDEHGHGGGHDPHGDHDKGHGSHHDAKADDGDDDDPNVSLILGPRVTMNDPSSAVVGDSVWLKAGASVYDVQANELVARRATVLGTRTTNVAFPFAILPVTPDIDAGHQTLTVDKRHTRTLAPGAYGHVQVQHGATLVLTGGLYQFASLALEADATLVYRAAAEIRIGGDLETGARAVIAPDAAGLAAASLKIEVDGCEESDHRWIRHDRRHLPRPARAAVRIGAMNTIQANVLALESGITIGARTEATGAFIGDEVFVGPQVRLRLDSAF